MLYENDNYKVIFSLTGQWDGGYNASVKIENTGESTIENWCTKFDYQNDIPVWYMKSDPNIADSDGDTYSDSEDRYPLVVAVNSDMFQKTEDYSMEWPYLNSDYQANYGTGTYDLEELTDIYSDALSDCIVAWQFLPNGASLV